MMNIYKAFFYIVGLNSGAANAIWQET